MEEKGRGRGPGNSSEEYAAHKLLAEVTKVAHDQAPQRFALCVIDDEAGDTAIRSWGLDFGDEVVLVNTTAQLRYAAFQSVFQSAELARSALARRSLPARAVLVWIDH